MNFKIVHAANTNILIWVDRRDLTDKVRGKLGKACSTSGMSSNDDNQMYWEVRKDVAPELVTYLLDPEKDLVKEKGIRDTPPQLYRSETPIEIFGSLAKSTGVNNAKT